MFAPSEAGTLFGWASAPEEAGRAGVAADIAIVGLPSDSGNGYLAGARFGPEAIRAASRALRPPRCRGIDAGDLAGIEDLDGETLMTRAAAALEAARSMAAGTLMLGGDHGLSYAGVRALAGRPCSVVWFDAHTDFCSRPADGWHDHKQVLKRIAALPHVERMVVIGHRGITYDDESLRHERLAVVRPGPLEEMRAALLDLLPRGGTAYLSIDIDAVDPRFAPGTGHPVPGGLGPENLQNLALAVTRHMRVKAADLMEVNPRLDVGSATSRLAAVLAAAVADGMTGGGRAEAMEAPFPHRTAAGADG